MEMFIIQLILVLSLGFCIYLLSRALPRVSEEVLEAPRQQNVFERAVNQLPLERIDVVIHSFFEKGLRKTKIVVLKVDNVINNYLSQLKEYSAAQEQHSNLKEKMEIMTNGMANDRNGKENKALKEHKEHSAHHSAKPEEKEEHHPHKVDSL